MKIGSFLQRRFDPAKLQKLNVFETDRFYCDVYCLLPGQVQTIHAHEGSDKIYLVLEGAVVAQVAGVEREMIAGDGVLAESGEDHGLVNRSDAQAAVLVFMAPRPGPKALAP